MTLIMALRTAGVIQGDNIKENKKNTGNIQSGYKTRSLQIGRKECRMRCTTVD